jgi:hypothetical protein
MYIEINIKIGDVYKRRDRLQMKLVKSVSKIEDFDNFDNDHSSNYSDYKYHDNLDRNLLEKIE